MTSAPNATVHREFVMGSRNFPTISFPDDFMFQLAEAEAESLRSQIVILDVVVTGGLEADGPVRGRCVVRLLHNETAQVRRVT